MEGGLLEIIGCTKNTGCQTGNQDKKTPLG
jgi:hypothetical protein